jgi:translation initiation factor IF-3
VKEVRVIGEDGKQLGIMPTHIACRIAEEKGLDLVEVNPKAAPPVCKIIDHGKFKYEEARKKRSAKKKQTVVTVKEVKLRPKTDVHDLQVKIRAIQRFLSEGNKAKLVIVFRGREIVHPETGKTVLLKVLTELAEFAVVEQMPLMEGRRMTMLIAPKPGAAIPLRKKEDGARSPGKPVSAAVASIVAGLPAPAPGVEAAPAAPAAAVAVVAAAAEAVEGAVEGADEGDEEDDEDLVDDTTGLEDEDEDVEVAPSDVADAAAARGNVVTS